MFSVKFRVSADDRASDSYGSTRSATVLQELAHGTGLLPRWGRHGLEDARWTLSSLTMFGGPYVRGMQRSPAMNEEMTIRVAAAPGGTPTHGD
jgi:hypothetical protein